MIQLGEGACAVEIHRGGPRGRRVWAGIVAAACAGIAIATPKTARGDDVVLPTPNPEATADERAQERAQCDADFKVAAQAIQRDAKYARNWTDAWYVVGGSLMALSYTNAFQHHDYQRAEGIVNGTQGLLLMIQVPTATSSAKALQGLRTAEPQDPCLALVNARQILEVNVDDAAQHQNWFAYVFSAVLPLVSGTILALSTKHWDFANNGAEGLGTLVGIAAGELQVLTYPQSSLKVTGTSLQMQF